MQGPTDGDPHHHPHPGLLGEQGAKCDGAFLLILEGERLAQLRLVALGEPAASLQGLGEDPLQAWRCRGDGRLGIAEARGIGKRLDRSLELRLGVFAGRHRVQSKNILIRGPRAAILKPAKGNTRFRGEHDDGLVGSPCPEPPR